MLKLFDTIEEAIEGAKEFALAVHAQYAYGSAGGRFAVVRVGARGPEYESFQMAGYVDEDGEVRPN